ncbi:MAG: hypothetical protein IPJ20_25950 [Flammeovirgaceae bacterium]|nr:hypothetical protein [Flammeovirgaceae bacterium]
MGSKLIDYQPYLQKELEALSVEMPTVAGLSILTLQLEDLNGKVLHHNFVHFEVISETALPKTRIFSVAPANFTKATWSAKQWNVLDGLKVNGAGSGFLNIQLRQTSQLISIQLKKHTSSLNFRPKNYL